MLNVEIWEEIKGYDGRYCVSSAGRIRNASGRILKFYLNNSGYLCIKLAGRSQTHYLVHRLVAETFLSNPSHLPVVNHKDSDRLNNRVENLEWVTVKQNLDHARAKGRMPYNKPTLGKKLSGGRRGTSKYHGVFRKNYTYKGVTQERWVAYLCIQGRTLEQKLFLTEMQAALHYDYLIDKYAVDCKPKNFPNETKCLTTTSKEGTAKRPETVATLPEGC